MIRQPVVADYFYPAEKEKLERFFSKIKSDKIYDDVKAVIVPHAGYIYSGTTAFKTLSSIKLRSHALIMGPNHTGLGADVSVFPEGSWLTPFGEVKIDEKLVDLLTSKPRLKKDILAHKNEHSIEVILPMLKYLSNNIKIVPIIIKNVDYKDCLNIARDILEGLREYNKDILLIVSSDFNHYENSQITEEKDEMALDAILSLDSKKLYEVAIENNITMCGIYAAIIAIEVSKSIGASKGELIEHSHSGFVSGDYNHTVGYAGVVII